MWPGMSAPLPRIVTPTPTRSPYLPPLGALAALALAVLLAHLALPGSAPVDLLGSGAGKLAPWQRRLSHLTIALSIPPRTTARALEAWPHVVALGLAALVTGVVSAARGRAVRGGGRAVWAALLVASTIAGAGYLSLTWSPPGGPRPGAPATFAAACLVVASLGQTAANVGLGRVTGLSGTVVVLAAHGAGRVYFLLQHALTRPRVDLSWDHLQLVEDPLALAITLTGGLWLVRRHRLGDVDLAGPLAACATPAEVAVLPYVASTLLSGAVWGSVHVTRTLLPGSPDLTGLLCTGWPWLFARLTLALLGVAWLAWLLARRERRDRG